MAVADLVIMSIEAKLDKAIGRELRLAFGRYASVVAIGIPIAWAIPGFRWDQTSTYGLLAGVLLYALVDIVRVFSSSMRGRRK